MGDHLLREPTPSLNVPAWQARPYVGNLRPTPWILSRVPGGAADITGVGKASSREARESDEGRTPRTAAGSPRSVGRPPVGLTGTLGACRPGSWARSYKRDVKAERARHLFRHRTGGCLEAGLPHLPKWEACWLHAG